MNPASYRQHLRAIFVATGLMAIPAHAVNLADAGGPLEAGTTITSTIIVGAGDWFQPGVGSTSGTLTINAGGVMSFTDPTWETIIQQNVAGTSTININTGGTMSFAGISANGRRLFVGNQVAGAIGIINLNGGVFDGSGLTTAGETIFGRGGATGFMTISNGGSAVFGSAPVFGNGGGTGYINFTGAGTLAIPGADYAALYAANSIRFNGGNTADFASVFQVNGGVLSQVPEPSAALLGALGVLGLIRRRRL